MFKCEKCHRVTEPREKQTKISTITRPKIYENKCKHKNRKNIFVTYGEEIVKEISICERCAAKHESKI